MAKFTKLACFFLDVLHAAQDSTYLYSDRDLTLTKVSYGQFSTSVSINLSIETVYQNQSFTFKTVSDYNLATGEEAHKIIPPLPEPSFNSLSSGPAVWWVVIFIIFQPHNLERAS